MNTDAASTLCPQCLAVNVIATTGGPTCRHSFNSGLLWWPSEWERMPEYDRIAWLEKRQKKAS